MTTVVISTTGPDLPCGRDDHDGVVLERTTSTTPCTHLRMPEEDRERWNARYSHNPPNSRAPNTVLTLDAVPYLPKDGGRALDVAGGTGRHGIWLARLGFDVTICDISGVGLDLAKSRAERVGLRIQTLERDLEEEAFPHPPMFGPWDVVVCVDYLQRSLFERLPPVMARGGVFVFAQPTVRNLERHERPPRRYLLEEGEIVDLIPEELEVLHHEERWFDDDRHEARLIAARR